MDTSFSMRHSSPIIRTLRFNCRLPSAPDNFTDCQLRFAVKYFLSNLPDFLQIDRSAVNIERLFSAIKSSLADASAIGLLSVGGISKKDYVSLFIIFYCLKLTFYLESGVFIGSSLHSALSSLNNISNHSKFVAIDPNLSKVKLLQSDYSDLTFISHLDFSQLPDNLLPSKGDVSLAYFDDHINTASRLIDAFKNGFKFAIVDDACGFDGMFRRLYPALPSIPMIINPDALSVGDSFTWSYSMKFDFSPKSLFRLILSGFKPFTRCKFSIDSSFIESCYLAKSCIDSWCVIPELGDYIFDSNTTSLLPTHKYLVKFKNA